MGKALGNRANKIFGDVQPEHCRLLTLGGNFYAMALESKVGTVIDGKKYRQEDGPVPLRDGSTLTVGKYILYCENDRPEVLQDRRRRILAGENFWKLINAGSNAAQDSPKESVVEPVVADPEPGKATISEEQIATKTTSTTAADDQVPTDMDAAMEALSAMIEDDDDEDEIGDNGLTPD